MKKCSHLFIFSSFAVLTFLNSGCSVFSPVGEVLSDAYENTVSYFNAYYNARRAFDDAEEEIFSATKTARGKNIQQKRTLVVPGGAKQKLAVVIDKCSSILSFHPTSGLVDNALLLIGKSYFYQGEYLKAERKFVELRDQYPTSSLILEANLWHARALENLNKQEEAIPLLTTLTGEAEGEGAEEIAAEAHLVLANLYESRGDHEQAIGHFARVEKLDCDSEVKIEALLGVAKLHFSSGQFQKAADKFGEIPSQTSDLNLEFQSMLQISVCAERMGKHEEALTLTNDLIQDFRFKDYTGSIRLERARILDAGGRREDSMEEYRFLDTTFAKTETGALASFELGGIYERELGDYAQARVFYARAAENRNTEIQPEALRKSAALNRYLEAKKKIARNDSLLSASREGLKDQKQDSLSQPHAINKDSLISLNAALLFDIAETFYAELMEPDSAVFCYNRSLELKSDTVRAPRILFVLAEIARSHPARNFGNPNDYYQRLVKEYPDTKYADQARAILNLPVRQKETDPAEKLFKQAEDLIETNRYERAVEIFSGIIDKFPSSPFAAKSEYAIGWLFEHRLSKPDSAFFHYKRVIARFGSSPYAAIVRPWVADTANSRRDTVTVPRSKPPVDPEVKDEKPKDAAPSQKSQPPITPRKRED